MPHSRESEARRIHDEQNRERCSLRRAGCGAAPDQATLTLLTHCNTGSLATGGIGSALGVIKTAHRRGTRIDVLADETRPLLQGARLTAWELAQEGIPHRIIVDGAAAGIIARGEVDAVIVGADRIAANGDTANKIGTYGLAARRARARRAVLRRRARAARSIRRRQTAHPSPSRSARDDEVLTFGSARTAPEGVARTQPRVRRHAGAPDHRDRHRARRAARALRRSDRVDHAEPAVAPMSDARARSPSSAAPGSTTSTASPTWRASRSTTPFGAP